MTETSSKRLFKGWNIALILLSSSRRSIWPVIQTKAVFFLLRLENGALIFPRGGAAFHVKKRTTTANMERQITTRTNIVFENENVARRRLSLLYPLDMENTLTREHHKYLLIHTNPKKHPVGRLQTSRPSSKHALAIHLHIHGELLHDSTL